MIIYHVKITGAENLIKAENLAIALASAQDYLKVFASEINKAGGYITLTAFETGNIEYSFNTPDAALNKRIMLWIASSHPTD